MVQTTRFFTRFMGRWLMALLLVMLSSLATKAAEAYACYTSSNSTLTFYYDSQRSSRPGKTYDLNTDINAPGWFTDNTYRYVNKVVLNSSFANAHPTSTFQWFGGMSNLTSITGLSYLNTENVTVMGAMFMGCTGLTSIDLSNFNTANVTIMSSMFEGCTGLMSLDVTGFNTANVKAMGNMFYGCTGLTSLDVTGFNTANVTTMRSMFSGCTGLTRLDLSNFNTAEVTNMIHMFMGCSNLTTIYAGIGWTTNAVTTSTAMFRNCTSLVGGNGTTFDANHVDAAYAHIDGGPANPGYLSEPVVEAYACYTPSNTTLTFYYDNQRSRRPGTTYDLNTEFESPGWLNDLYDQSTNSLPITRVVFDPSFANARPTSTLGWFYGMRNLQSITGIQNLNTSEVTDMAYMFIYCESLTSLDLSKFNTANVTDMNFMFWDCDALTTLDLSSFNTANVTNMYGMFTFCESLTSLDLSKFNTANVTDMQYMFYGCESLTTIYAGSGWSTDGLNSLDYSDGMFYDCTSLVGGMGTTYDENYMDAARAHIDGGPSNPGYFTAKSSFLRGDVNGDGQVKISDVTALINYLLSGDASAINLQSADANQDGHVKISDVTALINYLLSGTW